MKSLATVTEILSPEVAVVTVERQAACDGCHKNADGASCSVCTLLGGKNTVSTRALNRVGAAVGDRVEVESGSGRMLFYAALVFLLPVLFLLVGFFVGRALWGSIGGLIAAGVLFLLCFVFLFLYSRFAVSRRIDVTVTAVIARQGGEEPRK